MHPSRAHAEAWRALPMAIADVSVDGTPHASAQRCFASRQGVSSLVALRSRQCSFFLALLALVRDRNARQAAAGAGRLAAGCLLCLCDACDRRVRGAGWGEDGTEGGTGDLQIGATTTCSLARGTHPNRRTAPGRHRRRLRGCASWLELVCDLLPAWEWVAGTGNESDCQGRDLFRGGGGPAARGCRRRPRSAATWAGAWPLPPHD